MDVQYALYGDRPWPDWCSNAPAVKRYQGAGVGHTGDPLADYAQVVEAELDQTWGHASLGHLRELTKFTGGSLLVVTPDEAQRFLTLPGISGLEVLRQIKTTPGFKRLSVVILTSSREEGDRATSYDNGANSYLIKPPSFPDFLEVVRQVSDYWLSLNVGPPTGA